MGLTALGICFVIFIIGVLKKIDPIEMFMTSVGLAVAAIPEGLPAVVTILLSIGVTKMAKENTIIRQLPAVETLGCSSVICSDKTGTLTQNKMTVTKIFENNTLESKDFLKNKNILYLASMCTNCDVTKDNYKYLVSGEPTEKAIVEAVLNIDKNYENFYASTKRINEVPFDSKRKLMTTIYKTGNNYKIITKGAPDVLLTRCNKILIHGKEIILDKKGKDHILEVNNNMANDAMRVIGVSYLKTNSLPKTIDENIEKNLVFVGLIGMIDPPRNGVSKAVNTCRQAGIKTAMITGDHILTAKAIAKDIGILKAGDKVITGEELEKMSQEELEDNIMDYSVFARVAPEHKVRIVKAFRKKQNVVAMTGDGVNDAPALNVADIGIAMGKGGTDVAKNASDMILADDNFVSIVEAVKNGRHIYENIKKAIHFLLATNIGEIVAIFFGLLLGLNTPLVAIQLLWINLVTDSLPAIALGMEPVDKDIMHKKPIKKNKSIFSDGLWSKIVLEGFMIGILTLFAFSIGNSMYNLTVARTMAFTSLGILELLHSLNVRTNQSIFKENIFNNMYLLGAIVLGVGLQVLVTIIPAVSKVFKVSSLNPVQWLIIIMISITPIIVIEMQKKLNEIKFGKTYFAKQKV